MELGLGGKLAVVTGASKGIGLAVTRRFVEEGARVVAGSRSVTAELAAASDRLDILVNNVGVATPRLDGFLAITDDMWQHTLNLDFMAGVRAIRAATPVMVANGGGVIVNVGSINGRLRLPMVTDYSAAKAAFNNLPRRCQKSSGRRTFASTRSIPVRSPPTSGPVATGLRACWVTQAGSPPTRSPRSSHRTR